jgi:cholecystokinin A receptor/hypocretin (orexin) receptor 2
MPGTIVEIWNLTKWNEALCKLFEQLRATGFVLSNFIVIIISFERYFLMCKPFVFTKFKNTYLKKTLFIITLLSFFIGILSMLQLSVYQKVDDKIVFIGVCLPSEMSMTFDLKLKFIITSLFLFGACIVGFLYVLIFKSAFLLNKKKQERLRIAKKANSLNTPKIKSDLPTGEKQKDSFQIVIENDSCINNLFEKNRAEFRSQNQLKLQSILSRSLTNLKVPMKTERRVSSVAHDELCDAQMSSSESIKEINKSLPITFNQKFSFIRTNFRMAFMIFLVTLVYYISIIPWCLTINDWIRFNVWIYYTFVINSAVNPIIYGFFNPNFRNNSIDILKLAILKVKNTFCFKKQKS